MGHGGCSGRELKCLGMQQSSTGAVGLKARMPLINRFPLLMLLGEVLKDGAGGEGGILTEKAMAQPHHSEYK